MKVLITGSSGFVGRHLTEFLSENNIFTPILSLNKSKVNVLIKCLLCQYWFILKK